MWEELLVLVKIMKRFLLDSTRPGFHEFMKHDLMAHFT